MSYPYGFSCRYPDADPVTRAFAAHSRRGGEGALIPSSSSGWNDEEYIIQENCNGVLGVYRWTGKKIVFVAYTLEGAGLPNER